MIGSISSYTSYTSTSSTSSTSSTATRSPEQNDRQPEQAVLARQRGDRGQIPERRDLSQKHREQARSHR
jgi:hypothetical protein